MSSKAGSESLAIVRPSACENIICKTLHDVFPRALQGNPLECGCDALWLSSFLSEHGLSGPMCEQPDSLAGRDLLSLREEEYCCKNRCHIQTALLHKHSQMKYECMFCTVHSCSFANGRHSVSQ